MLPAPFRFGLKHWHSSIRRFYSRVSHRALWTTLISRVMLCGVLKTTPQINEWCITNWANNLSPTCLISSSHFTQQIGPQMVNPRLQTIRIQNEQQYLLTFYTTYMDVLMHKYYMSHIIWNMWFACRQTDPFRLPCRERVGCARRESKAFLRPNKLAQSVPDLGTNISIGKPFRNLFHPHLLMGIIHCTTWDFIHHATRAGIGHAMLVVWQVLAHVASYV